jgi:predicted transcriptional regulator
MTWLVVPTARRTRLKLVLCDLLARNCFTDISITLLLYTANLMANMGPHWKVEAETDKVEYIVR